MIGREFISVGYYIYARDIDEAKNIFKRRMRKIMKKEEIQHHLDEMIEIDYDSSYAYFPIEDIKEEHIPYIYDYKRKDGPDPIASLPLSIARQYDSYAQRYAAYKLPSVLPFTIQD